MPNVLLNSQMILNTTLAELTGKLHVVDNMTSKFEGHFAKEAMKIGSTVQVRKPQRFLATSGIAYQGSVNPITNQVTPIVIDQLDNVHFEWDAIERTMSLYDVKRMYAEKAATALANSINSKCAEYIALNTSNQVGTPGTDPTTTAVWLSAGDKLVELGMPENMEDDLTLIVNRRMGSAYIAAQETLFNDQKMLSKQKKTGKIVDQLGYNWKRDQTIYTHTTGAFAGTILVNGATQGSEGGDNATGSLITDGHTSGVSTIKAGDVFRITGVYAVHPQTRRSTGRLKDFRAITTQTDTTGAMTILHAPAITASGQYQNVDSQPANDAPILMSGAASAVSTQGLLLSKEAFAFCCVPMIGPEAGTGCKMTQATDPDTGITMQMFSYFDGNTLSTRHRLEVQWGRAPLYSEMACRIAGA